jgi:hypothetical protein
MSDEECFEILSDIRLATDLPFEVIAFSSTLRGSLEFHFTLEKRSEAPVRAVPAEGR